MNNNLDLKDRKLLYELDLDSRQSFNKLAKKIGLSKNSIAYRINRLQKIGIINQFHTVVDIGKLGYISFRLYLKLQNTTPDKEEEIINFLKKKEIVTWIVSIEGDYNLGCLILTKSIKEMNSLWKELIGKYVNYFDEKFLTIMTKVSYFSRSYLIDLKKNDYEIDFVTESEEIKIDDTDKEILKLLAPNSRISIIEIAHKLKITSKTAIARIKNLENKKIIIGYKTVFDIEKLGYQYFKIHFNLHNLTEEKRKEFKSFVKNHPNIIYDNEVLGGDDFEIEIQTENSISLRKILEQIKSEFSKIIKNYKILNFYKEHKYLFLPVKI